jgi:hypothetical protein
MILRQKYFKPKTCQRLYNFNLVDYKSFYGNDLQTAKAQYDKKNGL